MKTTKYLALLVVLVLGTNLQSQCKDSLTYPTFRNNWNNKVSVIKDGTWKLPVIDFTTIKKDSFEMVHQFVLRGITFKANINKSGCINKASIIGRIDDSLNVQGALAMLYLVDLFNHELKNSERQKVFNDLKAESENKKGASSTQIGKHKYTFEPGLIANMLTVEPGRN